MAFVVSVVSVVCALWPWRRSAQPRSRRLGRISFPTSGSAAGAAARSCAASCCSTASSTTTPSRRSGRRRRPIPASRWPTGARRSCYNQPLWFNENLDKARAALARLAPTRAARQAKAPTAREKGYLDAVERLFGDGDKPARDRAYADRMARAARAVSRRRRGGGVLRAGAARARFRPGERNPAVSLKAGEHRARRS